MKIIIKDIINESEDKQEKLIKKYSELINTPYFYDLKSMDVPEEYWKNIFSYKFNQPVTVKSNYVLDENGNTIYREDSNGYWTIIEYDDNGNETYSVDSYGRKIKTEYNNNGHTVYYENEDGYWYKQLFDIHDNLIYFEDSNGHIDDYRYEEGN